MIPHSKYAPEFRIEINGAPIPPALRGCITSVSLTDGIEGADRVEVAIANPNLRWLDDPLLQVDNGFELHLGYAQQPVEKVFVGEITGVNATFPSGGIPTLTIVAHDFLQRLTTGAKDRAFYFDTPTVGHFPMPDPYVAAIMAGTNMLIPMLDPVGAMLSFLTLILTFVIDPEEAKKSIRYQQGTSDFDLLSQIAKENGWEMYIDHTIEPKGYVLRFPFVVQDYSPSLSLQWGASLLSFSPRLTTVGQVAGIATRIWVSAIEMELVIVLSWDFDRKAFDLMVYPGLGSLKMLMDETASQSVLKIDAIGPATAPRALLSELLPRLNNRLTGSGSCMGDLRLRAGRVIELKGLGSEFSGSWRVTSANHVIDNSGYRTDFEVRREVWFGPLPFPKSTSGLFRVQGKTIQ